MGAPSVIVGTSRADNGEHSGPDPPDLPRFRGELLVVSRWLSPDQVRSVSRGSEESPRSSSDIIGGDADDGRHPSRSAFLQVLARMMLDEVSRTFDPVRKVEKTV